MAPDALLHCRTATIIPMVKGTAIGPGTARVSRKMREIGMASAQLTLTDGTGSAGGHARPRDLSFELQQMTARQIWFLLRRHIKLVAGIVITCVLIVLAIQLQLPKRYQATATVQVQLNDSSGSNQADAVRNQQRVANEARMYRSQALAEQVVRDLKLHRNPAFNNGVTMKVPLAASHLLNDTQVASSTDSDVIDITVQSGDPELAARIANRFVQSLQKLRSERRQVWRDEVTRALANEAGRLSSEAWRAEQAVADFRRDHAMPVGAGSAEDYQQMNRLAVEAASSAALSSGMRAQAAGVSSAAGMRTVAGATSPALDNLQRQYDDLSRQRSEMAVQMGANHPQMQALTAQISQVSNAMTQERASVIAAQQARNNADAGRERAMAMAEANAAAARAGQLQARLNDITSAAFRNNANSVDLSILERKAEVARQAYLTTAQRAQTVRAELESTGVNSTMMSAAPVPLTPVAPAPKKMALAAFVGSSMLALLIVLGIEMFDNRLRSGDQLRRLFGLRTLAMLPGLPDPIGPSIEENPVVTEPQSLFTEVARNLASEVEALPRLEGSQRVLVTSPLPGDGKSSVALTLAAAAASMGRRAIVVDLDLRRPGPSVLRSIQDNSNLPDLIDVLTHSGETRKLIPQVESHVEHDPAYGAAPAALLPVVLSTREQIRNPAALVQGWQVARLLDELREQFDLVVINAPAILAVRDARTLSSLADSTIMVVRWGSTTVEQLRASLQMVNNQVAGAVFNQVDYEEHARRGYGDAVQFYMGSAAYYSDSFPVRQKWTKAASDRVRRVFTREAA